MQRFFEGITGESAKEMLKICDLDYTGDSLRLLLLHTIMFTNEFDQPKGQELRAARCFFDKKVHACLVL